MSAKEKVLAVILLEKNCAAACAKVEHKGYTAVGVIDEVTVTIAAANENGVNLVVCNKDILSKLHCGYAGAATVLNVDAPGILRADSVLNVAGGGCERIFLPLLSDTENYVNLKGINSAVLKALESGESTHLLSAVAGIG